MSFSNATREECPDQSTLNEWSGKSDGSTSQGVSFERTHPLVRPEPIIFCDRCSAPFNAKRETRLDHYESTRCRYCGKKHSATQIIGERSYPDESVDSGNGQSLYILQDETGAVKVGRSVDVESRLSSMQSGNPRDIHLVATFPVAELEAEIHEKLDDFNINGEWFDLSDRSLSAFVDSISALVDGHKCNTGGASV